MLQMVFPFFIENRCPNPKSCSWLLNQTQYTLSLQLVWLSHARGDFFAAYIRTVQNQNQKNMKTSSKFFKNAGTAFLIGLSLVSCQFIDPLPIKSNAPVFDVELFKENLNAQLAGARGYQFVITSNGRIAATEAVGIGAISRAGNTPSSIDAFVNIASVTKTLTATAALRVLPKAQVNLGDAIGPWLPDSWDVHSDISELTFRQLLTHTSGIRTSSTGWTDLRDMVSSPITQPKLPSSYANANFALFRAMLPKLNDKVLFEEQEDELTEGEFQSWMSSEYIKVIQNEVISRAGLGARGCTPIEGNTFQMLSEAPSGLIGVDLGNWTEFSGGGGFFLTTKDMSRIIVYLTHSDDILSKTQRTQMDSEQLGWNRRVAVKGGFALGHGGGLYNDNDNSESLTAGDSGLQTLLMKFPGKIELALSINSVPSTWRDTNTIVQTAFNDAWVKK